ncbi:TEX45 protein, partial [Nyctibius bracteatus]|nr:TEX45 protein [Nyctibius bracteatus]
TSAVPAVPVPLIPTPLTGERFLKASHFKLGNERSVPASAWQPLSHSQFPPLSGVLRPAPIPQPCGGQVLSSGWWDRRDTCSETRLAFPERPLQPIVRVATPKSHIRMHTDPRIRVLTSTMRESFPCPPTPLQRPHPPTANLQKDSMSHGDREKIRLPPSNYTFSYPAHEIQPAARPWCSHRGRVPTIEGDGQSYYTTSYQAQFKGEWSPAAKPNVKRMSPVKLGDPRSSGFISEQKHAYGAPDKRTDSVYDKEHAVSQIHRTNLKLGDGHTRFSTLTSEFFPAHKIEPVTLAHQNQFASSIPRGDEDPERNQALATTTQLSYPETDRWNLPPKPDLLPQKYRSSVCLREEGSSSPSFSTTQQSHYQPPGQSERVTADSRSHRESHIPFDYHNESSVSTMKATLVPHRQQKQRFSEEKLQQLKCSHLELPWKVLDLFRTEQKDNFTPKSGDPAEIRKGECQVSSVPLGTLKGYRPGRKVVFAS